MKPVPLAAWVEAGFTVALAGAAGAVLAAGVITVVAGGPWWCVLACVLLEILLLQRSEFHRQEFRKYGDQPCEDS